MPIEINPDEVQTTGSQATQMKRLMKSICQDKRTPEPVLQNVIRYVICTNPKAVNDVRIGKKKAFQYLVGKIMDKTQGRYDPQEVIKACQEKIDNPVFDPMPYDMEIPDEVNLWSIDMLLEMRKMVSEIPDSERLQKRICVAILDELESFSNMGPDEATKLISTFRFYTKNYWFDRTGIRHHLYMGLRQLAFIHGVNEG